MQLASKKGALTRTDRCSGTGVRPISSRRADTVPPDKLDDLAPKRTKRAPEIVRV